MNTRFMVAMRLLEIGQCRFPCQALERRSGIKQSPVEAHPTGSSACRRAVGEGQRDGASREGRAVRPRKCRSTSCKLLVHDSRAWFLHHRVAAVC